MGTWFGDYVFYPVSISNVMMKVSKFSREKLEKIGKRVPVYLSSIIVWFATIWHDASWNCCGAFWNCLVIVVSQEFGPFMRGFTIN